ncbi:putative disease resistance RPP13-like protein 1 [Rhodamnia argentea]|uniref:Disease resistance RPP13-like protein 1 n=1 Tax=Rhodamnia argentea TaxID=178133 RepID=A0A8B8Q1C6_9MYRT|nr:putative disease resistance RPP13-like protein 1 [Rhodamnia argentea]
MAIGETIVGSLLQVLLDKLFSWGLDVVQREGISTAQLNKWKRMLVTINTVLDDAEDKQLSGNRLVKLWLDDVRDLAYDLEDLLDEFALEAAQATFKAESSSSRGQVKRKFPFFGQDESSGSNPNLRALVSETKVQEIDDRLEEIATRRACLSLRETAEDRSNYTNRRLPSTSLPEPQFFGREKEEAEILELLTGEAENDTTLGIVPIVGMGGVGKTALAQRLFDNDRVIRCFESRAWVCVSDVFNVLDITKNILQSITGLSGEGKDLNWVQVKLKDSLLGKKFLVVLDDVWNEKYGEWTTLLKPFEAGAKGSKIILTTRNLSVVSMTGASPYPLEVLSLDDCTRLLAYHAIGATNFERRPDLEIIGQKMAEKCKGLPLATKILGGLLRNKGNSDEWEAILNNRMWDLPTEENGEVLPVLKLSYVHLPSYLKRCFVYFAIFPKDYQIERDELVLLWIAEGFLDGRKAKENILSLGRNHFDELVSRSFLQQSRVDSSRFSMHDLLNDLAKSIVGGTCFSSGEFQLVGNEDDVSLEKARYASFITSWCVTSESLRIYDAMKVLRSLILLNVDHNHGRFHMSNKVLHDLLTKLNYLRVFSLCHCDITEVPNCIGGMKHLRYLNFSYTNIEMLPESIGTLGKLQALILRGCQKLSMLPVGITKLVSLRFLDIRDTRSLKDMPLSISDLKNLIILSKFVVGNEKGSRLKELKNLPYLQGGLLISELHKVEEVRDADDANLFEKQGLSNLSLHWAEDNGSLRNNEREAQVLQSLRPHTNLENLSILFYGGATFPSWLDGPSYSKIVSLCLRGCPKVRSLPSLGQLPKLGELSLEGLHAVSMIGSEFYGTKQPFSSLTTLKFEQMLSWKDWSCYASAQGEVMFPSLQHLVVRNCPALIRILPCKLDHLIKLEIRSCPLLNISTSVVSLPSLRELYLEDCDKDILKSMVDLTSLTILEIENLTGLVCFDDGFMSCLVKLKELQVRRCDKLTYLWQDENETRKLTCLKTVVIERCPQLTSLVLGEELPCNLEWMEFADCMSLEKLPNKMYAFNSLRHLSIDDCPKLMGQTIPPGELSSSSTMSQLEYLRISSCGSPISFLFAKSRLAALKTLNIYGCKEVESLEEIVVESLNSMSIYHCENLRSLPQCLHMLSHLTQLYIEDCPELQVECFPPFSITPSHLTLDKCPKFKSLPDQWRHLSNLQTLTIRRCENIKGIPEGGLPPNLLELTVDGCENLKQPVREWGLHMLKSLKYLEIDCSMGGEGEKVSFPSGQNEDGWSALFPSSLTSLWLNNMRNVERLSSGLRNHLSSLEDLRLEGCPKLRYLPEDGFPPSLRVLRIFRCEMMKDRCSKLNGEYWHLIQEIPYVRIGDDRIQ